MAKLAGFYAEALEAAAARGAFADAGRRPRTADIPNDASEASDAKAAGGAAGGEHRGGCRGCGVDVLFGPAYKGIPLATALSLALAGRPSAAALGLGDVGVAYVAATTVALARGDICGSAELLSFVGIRTVPTNAYCSTGPFEVTPNGSLPRSRACACACVRVLPNTARYDRKEAKSHGEGGRLVGASLSGKRVVIVDDVVTAGTAAREAVGAVRAAGGVVVGMLVCLDRQEVASTGPPAADVPEVAANIECSTSGQEPMRRSAVAASPTVVSFAASTTAPSGVASASSTAGAPGARRESAVMALAREVGCPVVSVLGLDQLQEYLAERAGHPGLGGGLGKGAEDLLARVEAYRRAFGVDRE